MTKFKTPNKTTLVKQIKGGYWQDDKGEWWLLNASIGWLPVNTQGRAFLYYMGLHLATKGK